MIKNILKGIGAYAHAFTLIRQLGLWKYFAIPILISFFAALVIGFLAWIFSHYIGELIVKVWPWQWGASTFKTIGGLMGVIIIGTLGLISYKHIILAFSAPFMSPVSEKIEMHILGTHHIHRNSTNASQLWRGIRINTRNLLLELLYTIPLLLVSFIPLLNIVTTAVIFLVQAYYAGFGNMDYTLERHLSYKKSIKFVRNNSGIAMGNGIVFMAMLFIPIIGIILVLPLSVTASTTETVRLLKENEALARITSAKTAVQSRY
jgi:CysZ protein